VGGHSPPVLSSTPWSFEKARMRKLIGTILFLGKKFPPMTGMSDFPEMTRLVKDRRCLQTAALSMVYYIRDKLASLLQPDNTDEKDGSEDGSKYGQKSHR
jgi:hypothetical protein